MAQTTERNYLKMDIRIWRSSSVHLLLAVVGGLLVLPEHHGSLGLGAALQEGAAVLDAVHSFIQEGRLTVQLIYTTEKHKSKKRK